MGASIGPLLGGWAVVADVLTFYQDEMIVSGWEPQGGEPTVMGETAFLEFTKPDRNATITLATNPQDDTTVVMVTVQSK